LPHRAKLDVVDLAICGVFSGKISHFDTSGAESSPEMYDTISKAV